MRNLLLTKVESINKYKISEGWALTASLSTLKWVYSEVKQVKFHYMHKRLLFLLLFFFLTYYYLLKCLLTSRFLCLRSPKGPSEEIICFFYISTCILFYFKFNRQHLNVALISIMRTRKLSNICIVLYLQITENGHIQIHSQCAKCNNLTNCRIK